MRRSCREKTWRNCPRCSKKTDINTMIRQQGQLICSRPSCIDTQLPEERDAEIARALNSISNTKEDQPHEKISDAAQSLEEIIF